MASSLEKKVLGGLGVSCAIIAGMTVVYHLKTAGLVESTDRVMQTHTMIGALGGLSRSVLAARMCTRGYVLTGDEDILRMYNEALMEFDRAEAALTSVASEDPHRRGHILQLQRLARDKLERCRRLIELKRSAGTLAAAVVAGLTYREDVEDPLRDRFTHLFDHAREDLLQRQRLVEAGQRGQLAILVFGALIELAFIAGAGMVIRRELLARRQVTREVEERELTLRSFYESGVTMMGIVELLDDDILIVSGNSATARMFSQTTEDIVGKTVSELGTPPELVRLFMEKYHESFRLGGPVEFEYERALPEVGTRWFSTVVCPIRRWAPAGRPRFSYILLDVTARKVAELALKEAQREADAANAAKSNFLANMSHEIRTPMTAILGFGDLLTEPGRSDGERAEWVGVIRRNARHLLELINDILDLSKIEAGKMTLESAPYDPSQVIGEVVTTMRQRAAAKGIVLRLELAPPIPPAVLGDAHRLRQVLVNLIGNAIKFTEAGEVAVIVACDGMALEIEVRDTGIGMTPQQLAKLFRPFTQADETTTRKFGGTGLGLSICQRLVSLLGGTLTARSQPGIGSAFLVTLPAEVAVGGEAVAGALEAAGSPARTFDAQPPRDLHGRRVLLAEDSPDMQRLLAMFLRRAGIEVSLATNGRVAIELAASRPFDAVLMDMQMPEVDGYCAAAELRRRGIIAPIIAVTAHAMSGDRERCLSAGCSDYLPKPIDPALLLQTLSRHVVDARGAAA